MIKILCLDIGGKGYPCRDSCWCIKCGLEGHRRYGLIVDNGGGNMKVIGTGTSN